MPLVGNIRDFGLSDFLYLVDRGYKTGGLHLQREQEEAVLFFEKGKLTLAARVADDHTGELLVRLGKLTLPQLAQARSKLQSLNGKAPSLTQIVIGEGFATQDELQALLYTHVEESVYGLFGWPDGEFRFEQNEKPGPDAPVMPTPVAVENLIMEGVRRIDEWGRIKDRIPSSDVVATFIEPGERPKGLKLAVEDWRVFARVNGRNTLAEIARKTSMSEFDVSRIVYGFVTAGLVDVGKKARPSANGNGSRAPVAEPTKLSKSLVNRIINRIRSM